jgi:hypothetical protein
MPDVADILTIVKNQALVGSGSTADDTRIMLYMNRAYSEIYRETAKDYPQVLLTLENVALTSGAGTLTEAPLKIMSVRETASYNFLEPRTILEIERESPTLGDTGVPTWYYMTSRTAIKGYPVDNSTLAVRYVPSAGTLTSTSVEADVKIPPEYQDLLIWGTLLWMAYDERDKGFGTEIGTCQAKYESSMEAYKRWLMLSQPREKLRTEKTYI